MRAMSASAEWKPKLRWLIRRILLLRPSRRPLESPRRIAARIPWRWARRVRARATNGASGSGRPGQPRVEVCGGPRATIRPPDGLPGDPQQAGDRGLGRLLGQPRTPCPREGLHLATPQSGTLLANTGSE